MKKILTDLPLFGGHRRQKRRRRTHARRTAEGTSSAGMKKAGNSHGFPTVTRAPLAMSPCVAKVGDLPADQD
ncbi:hypothetical protein LCGC14_1530350 [marine sediment metagenome]|uniref:Uncharacterized protein n=1 Tax=marine sediment metagenome TaxID=412755 RepID=A0A0F9IVZ8_9ZZZZ